MMIGGLLLAIAAAPPPPAPPPVPMTCTGAIEKAVQAGMIAGRCDSATLDAAVRAAAEAYVAGEANYLGLLFRVLDRTGVLNQVLRKAHRERTVVEGAPAAPEAATQPAEPEAQPQPMPKWAGDAAEVWDASLLLDRDDIGRATVRLQLHLENKTDVRLIGTIVRVVIKSPLGKILYDQTLEDERTVAPRTQDKADTFWSMRDNQFINDEPYDRLWQVAREGTATIETTVIKAVFDGGVVLAAKKAKK